MLFLNKAVFLNNLGAIPLRPTAMETVSNAPIAIPPPIAVPGASPPLAFISLATSPVPNNIDGRKAPAIPPTTAPAAVPSPGTTEPRAAPAFAPPYIVGKVTAILVATCGKALLNNQSAASPTSDMSSKVFNRLPDSKAGCTSCCARLPFPSISKKSRSPLA